MRRARAGRNSTETPGEHKPIFRRLAAFIKEHESDTWFAERCGIRNSARISEWKASRHLPSAEYLLKMGDSPAVDLSLDWLFFGDGSERRHEPRGEVALQDELFTAISRELQRRGVDPIAGTLLTPGKVFQIAVNAVEREAKVYIEAFTTLAEVRDPRL